MNRDAKFMRGQLASVGILLDQPTPARPVGQAPTVAASPGGVDREAIRDVLVAAGAPAGDLEWLMASCPSIEAARGYRPPARIAWCIECGDARPCNDDGCLACQAKEQR